MAVFLNRCKELGLSIQELDLLEYGTIIDMMIERKNDSEEWPVLASQEDFDRF